MTHKEIITALTGLAKDEIGLSEGLNSGDLAAQLDSVARLTLVVAIEDHFKICFDPEDEEGIHTVEQLVQLIERKLKNP